MTATMKTFEDFPVGAVFDLGSKRVERDEVIAFASRYDAQPMHLDEEAGQASLLGGLAASGWHTAAMFMRLLCDGLLLQTRGLGSPGIDRLQWLRPVRPGDTLSASAEVIEARPSKSRPGVGIVRFRYDVVNQDGQSVMRIENPVMIATRGA